MDPLKLFALIFLDFFFFFLSLWTSLSAEQCARLSSF